MRALLKDIVLVLVPENEEEASTLAVWAETHAGHVFGLRAESARGLALHDLGSRADACREPINVVSSSRDPSARLISNLGPAPFELDGRRYACVESFWQGLKFADEADRRRIAKMEGPRAMGEGQKAGYGETVVYGGETIPVGTWRHWQLMEEACRAKFKQCAEARAALLSTGERPLQHIVRRDSKAIPGVIMADIWVRINASLREMRS
jgi:predicted NAD-dependent protein-ADP-ribosyltransferase YbiA (DUF1768 family)